VIKTCYNNGQNERLCLIIDQCRRQKLCKRAQKIVGVCSITCNGIPLYPLQVSVPVGIDHMFIHLLTHMLLFSSHLAMLAINEVLIVVKRQINVFVLH
jgi:hypothetical protein